MSERRTLRAPAEDSVGELLRLAERNGATPEISPERTAHHKTFARRHWQRAIERRRRQRWGLAWAAAALLALGVGWALRPGVNPAPRVAEETSPESGSTRTSASSGSARPSLQIIAGTVRKPVREADGGAQDGGVPDGGSPSVALAVGALGAVGDVLETDSVGRAAMVLASGHELRLDVETRVRLVSREVLRLERGAVYVDSRGAPTPLEVQTPFGSARDIGTRFELRLQGDALRVRVRDGLVELDRDGDRHQARAGGELTVASSGEVQRREVAVYGPDWEWSARAGPAFEIRGRSLGDFLEWVERETGWRPLLDPSIAAASIVLDGSIVGLTPEEALGVVLPTSGLRHRIEDRILRIERIARPAASR
ncbi:MAG: FecR family protein [Acidobacteriota bacterium]